MTNREKALTIRADLNEKGYSDTTILDNILTNMLSGDEAIRAMDLVAEDFGEVEEYTEEEDFEEDLAPTGQVRNTFIVSGKRTNGQPL